MPWASRGPSTWPTPGVRERPLSLDVVGQRLPMPAALTSEGAAPAHSRPCRVTRRGWNPRHPDSGGLILTSSPWAPPGPWGAECPTFQDRTGPGAGPPLPGSEVQALSARPVEEQEFVLESQFSCPRSANFPSGSQRLSVTLSPSSVTS